jgi:hypothetical protein
MASEQLPRKSENASRFAVFDLNNSILRNRSMSYMPSFKLDRRADKTTGAELTFDYVVHRLGEVDFPDAVKRLGFLPVMSGGTPSDVEMELDFLGERYRLSKKDGVFACETVNGQDAGLNERSIVCYYALSKARGEPFYDFCLIDSFAHGVFSSTQGSGSGLGGLTKPLAEALSGLSPEEQIVRFAAAAESLGMERLSGGETGAAQNTAHKWAYQLLPKTPVQAIFYEEDDEFPPDLRVYWDKTAIQVFDFEPLAVLQGCFIHALVERCRE